MPRLERRSLQRELMMLTITLADDLQQLLRKKVEEGHYPNEEAVVETALRHFLVANQSTGPTQGPPATVL
jgi:hypothetical protein